MRNIKKCRENFSVWNANSSERRFAGGKRALKIGIRIFFEKSSDFVQKAPQFFKIYVSGCCCLGASRLGKVKSQDFPGFFKFKMQSLVGKTEVRLAFSENELKIHNQSFSFRPPMADGIVKRYCPKSILKFLKLMVIYL